MRRSGSDHPGGTGGLAGPSWAPHHPVIDRDLLVPSESPTGEQLPPGLVPKIPNCNHQQELLLLLGGDGDEPLVHGPCV